MTAGGGRVAILGGGMAGVTAAWELSRPGWRERHDSITLYQRDGVLGGKGASTRADDGRILEHGLHVWLGYYDNAFRLLRECYDELDRPRTDPSCPIRTWRDAFVPSPDVGVFEHGDGTVDTWVAAFGINEHVPGNPGHRASDLGDLVRRGMSLAASLLRSAAGRNGGRVGTAVDLVTTVLRGITADRLLVPGVGFGSVDHEDFRDWLRRHGAGEDTIDGGLVRGMYDLVFAYRDGDRDRPAFAAGLGVFLAVRLFLDYKGALFWKMTAGMGDVVFAPLHQALVQRGVDIRYFHRVDDLAPGAAGLDVVEMTRRLPPAFEPLRRLGDLPCFGETAAAAVPERLTLRRGTDFDVAVLAVSIGALPDIAPAIVRRDPRWRAMIEHVRTVPTRSVQLWLRDDETTLGWRNPGATLSGLRADFDTCASMSHLLEVEAWPEHDQPGALAYLCSAAPDPDDDVTARARTFVRDWSSTLWPSGGTVTLEGPAIRAHHAVANTDPSDRYVQSLPGSDRHRLRADGSGLDNLVLAGDWTDCGLNVGCIEAAVISGLQAAAVVEGRPLCDRVLGPLTWDWS